MVLRSGRAEVLSWTSSVLLDTTGIGYDTQLFYYGRTPAFIPVRVSAMWIFAMLTRLQSLRCFLPAATGIDVSNNFDGRRISHAESVAITCHNRDITPCGLE